MPSIRAAADLRAAGLAAAIVALAFLVAASVKRAPPQFSARSPFATIGAAAGHPLWVLRLAPTAHEIAADGFTAAPPPAGYAFQLWLAGPGGPRSLGLLPPRGRKIIPETPAAVARLARAGGLIVTLEPARGSRRRRPSGPVIYRAPFGRAH